MTSRSCWPNGATALPGRRWRPPCPERQVTGTLRDSGKGVPLRVSFYGVRGSTPCSCESNRRYGGNTACVALEADGEDPIILDLGTGLRFFGETLNASGCFRGTAFVSHLHWDHVQGLPFFVPVNRPGARLDIYGPEPEGLSLEEAFEEFMRPPYFPVRASDLKGEIRFTGVGDTDLSVGGAKVRVRSVPHVGPTNGYRIDWGGASVAYISDHQAPLDRSFSVADNVLDLCDEVDLLIHDAQYTAEEWEEKDYWGHCSVDYAVEVARVTGARRLALFHHDPSHGDDVVDRLLVGAQEAASGCGIEEVLAAHEGLTIVLGDDDHAAT